MKKLFFLFVMILFSQPAFSYFSPAEEASVSDPIVGVYDVLGKNNQDVYSQSYEGIAIITPCGQNYHIEWVINGKSFYGFGVKNGDYLACSYISNASQKLAVVLYKITFDGRLEGTWAFDGAKQYKIEQLTPS